MGSAEKKFIFGDDFGMERRDGTMRRASDRVALEEAEQMGYAAGFAAGQNAQQASEQGQLAIAMQTLASTLQRFHAEKEDFLKSCEQQSVALAMRLAILHGHVIDGINPHAGFVAAVRDVMARFSNSACLVARVPNAVRADIEAQLRGLAEDVRFSGLLNVEALPDGAMSSAFRLEWPEGALSFDRDALQAALAAEYERFGFSMTEEMRHG